jgi:protein-tyrosine phosphatase
VGTIYWIDGVAAGRLGIMARPRGGDWLRDEVAGWKSANVDLVLSLLEEEEIRDLGLEAEAELCRAAGIEYLSFPVRDFGVPESRCDAANLARAIAARISGRATVTIHCRGGIGRSALMAASVLIFCGINADAAFAMIALARGRDAPETPEQKRWVTSLAAEI